MSNVSRECTTDNGITIDYLLTWIKTTRVQTGLVTSLSLWVGFVSVTSLDIRSTVLLGLIGLSFHIFGFTLNEVKDAEYDASIGNNSVHPIARGDINKESARWLAWSAYIASVIISAISPYSELGTLVLILAVIPAYLYDEYSKTHWWSNVYLSVWAGTMVLSGALHAGTPNIITAALMCAVSIQIFVQVMQGDLKDLTGDEESVCRTLGVNLKSSKDYIDNQVGFELDKNKFDINESGIVTYTRKFVGLVYTMKAIEVSLLLFVVYTFIQTVTEYTIIYSTLYFGVFISFVTSLSMFMVWVYDRDLIKKYSSIHELSAIVLVGLTVFSIDPRSGIVIAIAPVIWYIVVNKILHSGALNPDV